MATRTNTTAEDIAEHWQTEQLFEELNTTAPSSTSGLARALTGNNEDHPSTNSLRGVDPNDMVPIGKIGDITVGRWTAGPADTLNIEFDWRFAQQTDEHTRAMMERAGKTWSYRIKDDFPTRAIAAGTHRYDALPGTPGTFELDEAMTIDDILIMVMYDGERGASHADTARQVAQEESYQPWLGSINLSYNHRHNSYVMVHEIGHIVMLPGFAGGYIPSAARYVNSTDHTFEGPQAMQANNGQPIPFLWVNERGGGVPTGTPGARPNYAHFECVSVVTYCGSASPRKPTEVDVGVLADIGYEVVDAKTASKPEVYGYGAWATYSAWGVGVARTLTGFDSRSDQLDANADAFGVMPEMTLADSVSAQALSGDATWKGVLLGVDIATDAFSPVSGDAMLSIDLDTLEGTASFDNLMAHENGANRAFRTARLEYDIDVHENRFGDTEQRVGGGFYGPDHQEMAGVVDDRRDSVNLIGTFGGIRED